MNKQFISFATIVMMSSAFWACGSNEGAVKEAENDVFAIHDEVMPKVDKIMKLQKQLRQRISALDSLKATGSAVATLRLNEDKEQAMRLSHNLTIADSLMMDWMSGYNGDTLARLSSEKALNYLAAQKDQITDVKTKVNASIEQASQFLDKK